MVHIIGVCFGLSNHLIEPAWAEMQQILMVGTMVWRETEHGKVVAVSRPWSCYEKQIFDFGFLLRRTI